LVDAVIELYRDGHLRGVVFGQLAAARERVLAFRKSPYVHFDLHAAEVQLNAAEALSGHDGRWAAERFLLASPAGGTVIPRQHLIETFLRI
jgi:hypothetical protein